MPGREKSGLNELLGGYDRAEVDVNMALRVTLAILGLALGTGVFVRRIALSSGLLLCAVRSGWKSGISGLLANFPVANSPAFQSSSLRTDPAEPA